MPATSDRNLLFGLLALKMDLVSREQLLDAMTTWLDRKAEPLALLLQERGALSVKDCQAVESLLDGHGNPRPTSTTAPGETPRPPALDQTEDHVGARDDFLSTAGEAGLQAGAAPAAGAPRYAKLRPHARGGLGEVAVAVDGELKREVALKEIQAQYADRPEHRARFVREAEITGNLEHPGIVPVYGLGSHRDGRPYYAMRFIRGETLQDAIARFHHADEGRRDAGEREMALRSLLGRFVAVCNAVAYAHSRGVVHRDLKPANVMLGEYGETLVVDWGLAKVLGQDEGAVAVERPLPPPAGGAETEVGRAVGTPAFMPPEQARGELDRVDQRSDVFALGATLYCLLTGRPPYQRQGIALLAAAAAGDHPPARAANPRVPAALEAVCARAMAARPEDRYARPQLLAADVERWLADEPVTAMPEPAREKARRWAKRNRTLVASGVVLLLASVVGLGVGLGAVRAEERRTASQRDRAEEAERTANSRREQAEANLKRAVAAEREAKDNLKRATDNLKLARDAVDGCYRVVTENRLFKGPRLSQEAHALKRLLLQQALPFYQHLRERRPGDVGASRDVLEQHLRVGRIQAELGSYPEAAESYRRAEAEGRALARAHPGVAEHQKDLADTLNGLGNVQDALGRPVEAVSSYREAVGLYRALGEGRSGEVGPQLALANSLNNLGRKQQALGQPDEALTSYAEAITLLRALARPGAVEVQNDLASALTNRGSLLEALDRSEEALEAYGEAATLLRELLRAHGGMPDFLLAYAATLNNLGNVQRSLGRRQDALKTLTEAVGVRRALVRARPGVPDYRNDLGTTLTNLGVAQGTLGQLPLALQSCTEAAGLGRALVREHPRVPGYRSSLGATLINLGNIHWRMGRRPEALRNYTEGVELRRAAAAARPEAQGARLDLVDPLLSLSLLLRELGRFEESRRVSDEALTLLGGLERAPSPPPQVGALRGFAHRERALALLDLGRYRAALPDWDRALALAPATQRPRLRLDRAVCLARAGEHDRAAAEARELAELAAPPPGVNYLLACVLSLSAAGAQADPARPLPVRERDAEARARQAVGLLGRAARAGLFRQPPQIELLGKDRDLDFLRGRADFRALVASLRPPE